MPWLSHGYTTVTTNIQVLSSFFFFPWKLGSLRRDLSLVLLSRELEEFARVEVAATGRLPPSQWKLPVWKLPVCLSNSFSTSIPAAHNIYYQHIVRVWYKISHTALYKLLMNFYLCHYPHLRTPSHIIFRELRIINSMRIVTLLCVWLYGILSSVHRWVYTSFMSYDFFFLRRVWNYWLIHTSVLFIALRIISSSFETSNLRLSY